MGKEDGRRSRGAQVIGLIVWLIVCLGVAALGGLATAPNIPGWYAELTKPDWTPPDWLFGPVWTVLYVLMALAAWLVWRQGASSARRLALALFGIQLALNGLWSFLFFGFQQPGIAFGEIVLLWIAILTTLLAFWKRSRTAGALLAPYLAWVSFAALLNFAIWRLNS